LPGALAKGDLGPGTYATAVPGVELVLEVDAGWRVDEIARHSIRLALADRGASKATIVLGQPNRIFSVPCGDRNDVVSPSLANLIPALQANDDLALERTSRRYIGGQPALQVDGIVTDGWDCYSTGRKNIRLFTTTDLMSVDVWQHELIRLAVINFGGNDAVAVLLQAPSTAEFDVLAAKVESLLGAMALAAT
jgi:hypothetical protein